LCRTKPAPTRARQIFALVSSQRPHKNLSPARVKSQ
jgi:hypothetical protein